MQKEFIFGLLDRTKTAPGMAFHDPMNVAPGFFILDTHRNALESGLTESELLSRMRQLEINPANLRATQHR
jgi:hypothetical protein